MLRPSPSPVTTHTESSGRPHLEAGRERGGTTVDPVEAIRVHVVGKTGGTPDPRDKHDVLLGDPEVWEYVLDLGQDGIVSASGAPTDSLV